MLFLVDWRGESGVCDEPQHRFMGGTTPSLLEVLGICCDGFIHAGKGVSGYCAEDK